MENQTVTVVCPHCNAAWELDEQEAQQESFVCTDCKISIPVREGITSVVGEEAGNDEEEVRGEGNERRPGMQMHT